MLKHRIIPIVLLDGYSVLKTIQFDTRRNLGNPITVARIYNSRHCDELCLLDIDASKQQRKIDLFTVEEVASECQMPLTVGGGLRTVDDVRTVLAHGADKVSINTAALENPQLITEIADVFGVQCVVVSIDVRKRPDGTYAIHSHSGLSVETDLESWVLQCEKLGAGEILLNSVDRDGTQAGFDLELISTITSLVRIPVISAGGANSPDNAAECILAGSSAVAAASLFHFTSVTPNDIKKALLAKGLPARSC